MNEFNVLYRIKSFLLKEIYKIVFALAIFLAIPLITSTRAYAMDYPLVLDNVTQTPTTVTIPYSPTEPLETDCYLYDIDGLHRGFYFRSISSTVNSCTFDSINLIGAGTFRLIVVNNNDNGTALGYVDFILASLGFVDLPNQPPTVSSIPNATINEGATYSANGSITDPDNLGWIWTLTVDYGDGSEPQVLTVQWDPPTFSLSHVYQKEGTYTITVTVADYFGATGTTAATVTVQRQLISLLPASVWVGLENSQDKGIKYDLKAEVYVGNTLISSGEVDSIDSGGAGFNNANLNTISFNSFSPVDVPSGSQIRFTLSVRNSCTGSKNNGKTARLWYNDSAANSQFGVTIGQNTNTYYLLDSFSLGTTTGSTKKTIDVAAGAKCSAFKPFGTWTITP